MQKTSEELMTETIEAIEAVWEGTYPGVYVDEEFKVRAYDLLISVLQERKKELAVQHGYDMAFLATRHVKKINPYEKDTDNWRDFGYGLEVGDIDMERA
jgi:hypothetical protein